MNHVPEDRAIRAERWAFLAVTLLLGLGVQWMRGLWEPDEGRYSECAREMVRSGDWVHPTLQGVPHLTKPPGAYWLIAAGLELFGVNTFGARFFTGLSLVASAWTARAIGRRLLGDAGGVRAGWIYATMLYAVAGASVVSTDAFLAAAVNAALLCVVMSWTSARPQSWLAASGAAWGAAFLIKGPPAFLPFAGFAVAWLVVFRRKFPGGRLVSLGGVAAFLAVGLPWYLVRISESPDLLDYWLRRETVDRATSADHGRNNPVWWYAVVLVAGAVPWTWLWMRGARRLASDATARALVLWISIPVAVFVLVPSRMWLYLLPLAVPLALLAAAGAKDAASRLPARPWVLGMSCALLAGAQVAASLLDDERDGRALAAAIRRELPPGAARPALLSGRDMYGLSFYLDGELVLLQDPGAHRMAERWNQTFAAWIADARASGGERILVVEPGRADNVARARLGPALSARDAPEGWLIYGVKFR